MVMAATEFLTLRSLVDAVANGRRFGVPQSIPVNFGREWGLACCICGHEEREHERGAGFGVVGSGCRCCARTLTVPVRTVEVEVQRVIKFHK